VILAPVATAMLLPSFRERISTPSPPTTVGGEGWGEGAAFDFSVTSKFSRAAPSPNPLPHRSRWRRGLKRASILLFGVIGACFMSIESAAAAMPDIASHACNAITSRVDSLAGNAPVFLRSYDNEHGSGEPDDPALKTAAFTYDNALAVITLLACGKPTQAQRIGEALRLAATGDTRLRNAYRAGIVNGKPSPNGWWDAVANHWAQSADQMGTSTGNAAWAALAMLALHDATGDKKWLDAAHTLGNWIISNTKSDQGAGGFAGGIEGDDASPHKIGWKATEHNIDLAALFGRLATNDGEGKWKNKADAAMRFVSAQWSGDHFLVGTLPDGITPNRDTSGLDVQFWSVLLPTAPAAWCQALTYAQRTHGVNGGFDFNADRDGLWLEGTAQAALAYQKCGRTADASTWLSTVAAQFSTGGYIYATREARITTGLAVSSGSKSADFYYYRRPHLAATSWAAMAALNWNPFTGERR
jgi:hypothetical protein